MYDAVVVGVPDDKFGEAITAVVEPPTGATARRGRRSIAHVKTQAGRLQGAQAGARVDTIGRAANGKVDYKRRWKAYALASPDGSA